MMLWFAVMCGVMLLVAALSRFSMALDSWGDDRRLAALWHAFVALAAMCGVYLMAASKTSATTPLVSNEPITSHEAPADGDGYGMVQHDDPVQMAFPMHHHIRRRTPEDCEAGSGNCTGEIIPTMAVLYEVDYTKFPGDAPSRFVVNVELLQAVAQWYEIERDCCSAFIGPKSIMGSLLDESNARIQLRDEPWPVTEGFVTEAPRKYVLGGALNESYPLVPRPRFEFAAGDSRHNQANVVFRGMPPTLPDGHSVFLQIVLRPTDAEAPPLPDFRLPTGRISVADCAVALWGCRGIRSRLVEEPLS